MLCVGHVIIIMHGRTAQQIPINPTMTCCCVGYFAIGRCDVYTNHEALKALRESWQAWKLCSYPMLTECSDSQAGRDTLSPDKPCPTGQMNHQGFGWSLHRRVVRELHRHILECLE